jgi:plasmid stability protein
VPDWLYERLRDAARREGVSLSDLLRELLVEAVAREEARTVKELAKQIEALRAEIASLRRRVTRLEEMLVEMAVVHSEEKQ